MAAPLTEGDRTVGALSVDSLQKEAFQEADLRLLTLMANEASRVLENMWMVQQLRRKAVNFKPWFKLVRIWRKAKVDEILQTITVMPCF